MGICGATAVEQPVITGEFMPSGVYSHGYAYKIYVKSWVNYCPACHKYHALLYNPKGVYEGELTCKYCGADFDGVTGYEKLYHPRWRLTPVYYKDGKAVVYAGYLHKKYKKYKKYKKKKRKKYKIYKKYKKKKRKKYKKYKKYKKKKRKKYKR